MAKNQESLTVFFDGLCHLCSREIDHYRKMKGAEKILFVDITAAEFNANREGLDPKKVHESLHARAADGSTHIGVDAFIQIWLRLDSLLWLAAAARLAPVRWSLGKAYALFAKIRPLLPRKSCASSPYCEIGSKP